MPVEDALASRMRAVLRWALLAALAASLCGNVLLGRLAIRRYETEEAVRLDPAGLKVYAGRPPLATGADERPIVLLGDSRAAMWKDPKPPPGHPVVNRGIGYQTTAQIAMRLDSDVAPLHPSVVVLEAGVNDLKTIAAFPERRAEIVADCEDNLARIVRRCTDMGAAVVLVTVFDIGRVSALHRAIWSDDIAVAVKDVNAFLHTLAGNRVVLLEAAPVLDDDTGHIAGPFQIDHLHLSEAGYAALNARLEPLLVPLVGTSVKGSEEGRPLSPQGSN
jgi:lysophospholipase L1-like esterase